jgi:hypothetical protein
MPLTRKSLRAAPKKPTQPAVATSRLAAAGVAPGAGYAEFTGPITAADAQAEPRSSRLWPDA